MHGLTPPAVVAVIVTHRRALELRRLLDGLGSSEVGLLGCVISDHSPDGSVAELARSTPFKTVVLEDPSNPGPGAGWANAARAGLRHFPEASAIWYLDDDVVIPSGLLGTLFEEMIKSGADSIAPLLEDAAGKLWAFPEPASPGLRALIRQATTPADARTLLGDQPIPFCWCTGACYLVTKPVIARLGFHREDFWMLGEDLEYSMRLAGGSRAVFTGKVSVDHLPHSAASPEGGRQSDYMKFCSLLQNLSYLAFHAQHSQHMKCYLPGNFRRFFRSHGPLSRTLRDAAACFWGGAVRAQPAGMEFGRRLRARISSYGF
ncbi:MAG: glycosyltransferase [Verrucomicrobiota bacterium]